jgi:hypothetical protein
MLRVKLFGLMLAFAVLALLRPRKVMELLEAADDGHAVRASIHHNGPPDYEAARAMLRAWDDAEAQAQWLIAAAHMSVGRLALE